MALDMDYIDVAARLVEFRTKHPEGSLQPANLAEPFRVVDIAGQCYIAVVAAAYRSPDDPRPGIGMAYEAFPGKTNFTRGSELQNAETSAWGRAIVAALAADTKRGIASAEEVRNRRAEHERDEPTIKPPDPVEVQVLVDAFLDEISKAKSDAEVHEIGKNVGKARTRGELPKAAVDKLTIAAGARKAELNGAAA